MENTVFIENKLYQNDSLELHYTRDCPIVSAQQNGH